MDVGEDGGLTVKHGVMGVPCVVLLHNSEVVYIIHGVKPKGFFRQIIQSNLASV